MEESIVKRTGTGLHILVSKKKFKEGESVVVLTAKEYKELKEKEEVIKLINEKVDELINKLHKY